MNHDNFYDVASSAVCYRLFHRSRVVSLRLRVVLLEKQRRSVLARAKPTVALFHPGHQSSPKTLKGRLAVRGNALFDELARDLKFGFAGLETADRGEKRGRGSDAERTQGSGDASGVPGLEIWSSERMLREEPNLSTN